ncbi:hypothetical protein ABW19_dt0201591 [Dactylella cylindrospora]|nr:hypothetical protein ABW19_dt0201591 [Dactylella cylindrospora]
METIQYDTNAPAEWAAQAASEGDEAFAPPEIVAPGNRLRLVGGTGLASKADSNYDLRMLIGYRWQGSTIRLGYRIDRNPSIPTVDKPQVEFTVSDGSEWEGINPLSDEDRQLYIAQLKDQIPQSSLLSDDSDSPSDGKGGSGMLGRFGGYLKSGLKKAGSAVKNTGSAVKNTVRTRILRQGGTKEGEKGPEERKASDEKPPGREPEEQKVSSDVPAAREEDDEPKALYYEAPVLINDYVPKKSGEAEDNIIADSSQVFLNAIDNRIKEIEDRRLAMEQNQNSDLDEDRGDGQSDRGNYESDESRDYNYENAGQGGGQGGNQGGNQNGRGRDDDSDENLFADY